MNADEAATQFAMRVMLARLFGDQAAMSEGGPKAFLEREARAIANCIEAADVIAEDPAVEIAVRVGARAVTDYVLATAAQFAGLPSSPGSEPRFGMGVRRPG